MYRIFLPIPLRLNQRYQIIKAKNHRPILTTKMTSLGCFFLQNCGKNRRCCCRICRNGYPRLKVFFPYLMYRNRRMGSRSRLSHSINISLSFSMLHCHFQSQSNNNLFLSLSLSLSLNVCFYISLSLNVCIYLSLSHCMY